MTHAKFNAKLFAIAHGFAGTDDTRYYINGVSIEPSPNGGVLITATNGHFLFVAHDVSGECDEKIIVKFPQYALGVIASTKATATIEFSDGDATLLAEDAKVLSVYSASIDGTFPDWRKIVPIEVDQENTAAIACFNADYISKFGKVAKLLAKADGRSGSGNLTGVEFCRTDGVSPMLVKFRAFHEAFVVLMPMRGDGHSWFLPPFMNEANAGNTAAKAEGK